MPKRGSVRKGHPKELRLWLSHDRKVSPSGYWLDSAGGRWVANVPNSFGLPAGESCPGKTAFCEGCYALNTEKMSGVLAEMWHNYNLLRNAGTVDAMEALLSEMMWRFNYYIRFTRRKKPIGAKDRVFRIHWDGDFFSVEYAQAWARVIRKYPDIQFWVYTRSFRPPVNVAPYLVGIPNLVVYLSVDEGNQAYAMQQAARYPELMLALCAEDYRHARALMPSSRTLVCPENNERMPLMSEGRGACTDCRLCPDGKANVLFSKTHREDASLQIDLGLLVEHIEVAISRGYCGNPACSKQLPPKKPRGRPAKYCSTQCRIDVNHAVQALRRRARNLTLFDGEEEQGAITLR